MSNYFQCFAENEIFEFASKDLKRHQKKARNPTFYGYKIRQKYGYFTQVYTHKQLITNTQLDIIYIVRHLKMC